MTTVIGNHYGSEWLDEWRERVGEAEAARVSGIATRRGSMVHSVMERWLLGEPEPWVGQVPTVKNPARDLIRAMGPLETVLGVEYPVWSRNINAAGRTDVMALWDGVASIVDFKTAKERKKPEDILGYFVQATAYGAMARIRTGVDFPRIVVALTVDHGAPQVFVRDRDEYLDEFIRVFIEERKPLG